MSKRPAGPEQPGALGDLEALFREHRTPLFAFALNLARNQQVAADVCQQTWLKLLETERSGRCPPLLGGALQAYLSRIARNVYIDHYVRSHDVCRVDCTDTGQLERAAGAAADRNAVEHVVGRAQVRQMLVEALAELPAPQTHVLCLWASGVTPATVARRARIPRDTILSRKKYGVAKLRRMLQARGLTAADLATAGAM